MNKYQLQIRKKKTGVPLWLIQGTNPLIKPRHLHAEFTVDCKPWNGDVF